MTNVTDAMSGDRPAKRTVRDHWMDRLRDELPNRNPDRVFYLTLPGAVATDVKLMRERGLLGSESNGAIPAAESNKVIAVESSLNSVAQLKRDFPGLNVIHSRLEALVGGAHDSATFPHRKARQSVVARFINLDFNSPLELDFVNGEFVHPQIEAIRKIATLQKVEHGTDDWGLFLTFQGEIRWSAAGQSEALDYLRQNAADSSGFRSTLESFFDEDVRDLIDSRTELSDLAALPRDTQQRLVCAIVPKRVAHVAAISGWLVETRMNWHYGGTNSTAPMCTWSFDFTRDSRSDRNPHAVYLDSVASILAGARRVEDDGALSAELA